jgi:dihydroxy-acid dehydratase
MESTKLVVSCCNEIFIEAGLLHGDCLTVTGKTLAENLAIVPDLNDGQEVIQNSKSIKATGNIQILFGNLAEKVVLQD